jgi:hypothetical protein
MYDGTGGTAKQVFGNHQELPQGTGQVNPPEFVCWWGNSVNDDTTKSNDRMAGGCFGGIISGSYAVNFGDDLNQTFSPAHTTARRVKTTRCEFALADWIGKRLSDGTSSNHADINGYFRFGGGLPGVEIKYDIESTLDGDLRIWNFWDNCAATGRDVRWYTSGDAQHDVDVEGGTNDSQIDITSNYEHPGIGLGDFDNDTLVSVTDLLDQYTPDVVAFEPKTADFQRFYIERYDVADPSPVVLALGEVLQVHYQVHIGDGAEKPVSNENGA